MFLCQKKAISLIGMRFLCCLTTSKAPQNYNTTFYDLLSTRCKLQIAVGFFTPHLPIYVFVVRHLRLRQISYFVSSHVG